jgi:hypothetical protein
MVSLSGQSETISVRIPRGTITIAIPHAVSQGRSETTANPPSILAGPSNDRLGGPWPDAVTVSRPTGQPSRSILRPRTRRDRREGIAARRARRRNAVAPGGGQFGAGRSR